MREPKRTTVASIPSVTGRLPRLPATRTPSDESAPPPEPTAVKRLFASASAVTWRNRVITVPTKAADHHRLQRRVCGRIQQSRPSGAAMSSTSMKTRRMSIWIAGRRQTIRYRGTAAAPSSDAGVQAAIAAVVASRSQPGKPAAPTRLQSAFSRSMAALAHQRLPFTRMAPHSPQHRDLGENRPCSEQRGPGRCRRRRHARHA